MRNKLTDLQNHLFEMIEDVKDLMSEKKLTDEELERKIKIHTMFNEYAKTAIANGALMVKCADLLYGIPVADEVPLIPKTKEETFLTNGKRSALLALPKPRDDGTGGYKRGRQQPI